MDRTFWDAVFGNPPFAPHVEVMSFSSYELQLENTNPARGIETEPLNIPIVAAHDASGVTSFVDLLSSPNEALEQPPDTTIQPVEMEGEPEKETGLVPVDSVTYSISNDDSKPRTRGLFKKRNKK